MEKIERNASTSPHVHVDAEDRHLDAALLQLDLTAELLSLEGSEPFQRRGHGAKTLLKQPELRVVLIALNSGVSLGRHETKGRLTIQVLKGSIALTLDEQRVTLKAGSLFALSPQIDHDVAALEASAILLTVAWPSASA